MAWCLLIIHVMNVATVEECFVRSYTIPTEFEESDGTLVWNQTTLVLVELRSSGHSGFGYTYGPKSLVGMVDELLKKCVHLRNAMEIPSIWQDQVRSVRNFGSLGASSMAISAIDTALWDLKAKVLNLPLIHLLGQRLPKVEVYGSGGFTSFSNEQLESQMVSFKELGIQKFKMKIGREPLCDPERVQFVRRCIGESSELFVDGNEALSSAEALRLAQDFARQGVTWFEQPIAADDLQGMASLRQRLPAGMRLTTGEYIFNPMQAKQILDRNCADVVQLDVTRCQGVTGFLHSASVCMSFNAPVSSHCAPALHVALGCHVPNFLQIEYFSDHARIESLLFEGVPKVSDGYLEPDLRRPGFGLEFNFEKAERYLN